MPWTSAGARVAALHEFPGLAVLGEIFVVPLKELPAVGALSDAFMEAPDYALSLDSAETLTNIAKVLMVSATAALDYALSLDSSETLANIAMVLMVSATAVLDYASSSGHLGTEKAKSIQEGLLMAIVDEAGANEVDELLTTTVGSNG